MTPDEIVAQAEAQGLQLVRFLYCDNGGVIRGKSTHVAPLARRMQSGIGLVKGMQSFTSLDSLAPGRDLRPGRRDPARAGSRHVRRPALRAAQRPDARRTWSSSTTRRGRSTRARSCSAMVAPRRPTRASRSTPPSRTSSSSPYRTDDGYVPVDRSLCFSAIGMESTEHGHPGHHRGADRPGADRRAVASRARAGASRSCRSATRRRSGRPTTRSRTARRSAASPRSTGWSRRSPPSRGPTRPAAAPTSTGASGTRTTRTNLLADATGPAGLSELARHAIAGVLAHLPGLLALTTPSINSFRRLQPHYWSSAYTAWGIENREAAVRVPSRYWDDEAGLDEPRAQGQRRSANPYIALGGVIAAVLDGIERGLDPGEPVDEDPGNLTDKEREARGIRRFPLTSTEALDELEKDEVLMGALGPGLATEYLKVRRAEAAAYAEKDEAFELDNHFFKY